MARGFGLRARLIGGGGGGQVGFGSGVAQGLNNMAAQIAAQNDPDVQMARQLQGLRIQAAQGQLQAQQQEQEAMAGYRRTGEEMFPEAGTPVPTEAEGPGAGQVLGTFAGEPTPDERLQKALWQTGNLKALAGMKQQQDLLALKREQLAAKPQAEQPMDAATLQALLPGETPEVYGALANLPRGEQHQMIGLRSQLRREQMTTDRQATTDAQREQARADSERRWLAAFQQRDRLNESKFQHYDENGQITEDPNNAFMSVPANSPRAKTMGASNQVYNHLQQGLGAYKNLMERFAGDRNRLTAYLNSSVEVFKNDPDAVKLYNFLEGPNAIAIMSLYTQGGASGGLRGSARLLNILKPSGITKGDNIVTMAESKFKPMAELNLDNVRDMGLPPAKFQAQLDEINRLGQKARQLNNPQGAPPPGTKWQRNTRTGEIRAMPIGQ